MCDPDVLLSHLAIPVSFTLISDNQWMKCNDQFSKWSLPRQVIVFVVVLNKINIHRHFIYLPLSHLKSTSTHTNVKTCEWSVRLLLSPMLSSVDFKCPYLPWCKATWCIDNRSINHEAMIFSMTLSAWFIGNMSMGKQWYMIIILICLHDWQRDVCGLVAPCIITLFHVPGLLS